MRLPVLFVMFAACGGNSKPPADPAPPATASLVDCTAVGEHVATVVDASKPRSGATHAAVKDMVATRCTADAWSDETKQCLHAMTSIAEGRACATGMTDAQRDAIRTAAKALRGATSEPTPPDDHSADWIRHVVEEGA